VCDDCAAGSIVDLASAATTCTPCGAGTIAAVTGATLCDDCAAGTVAAAAGATSCDDCAAGTIAAAAGSSVCTACAAGTIAAAEGSTGCADCAAGTIAATEALDACTDCAAGTIAATGGLTACTNCAAGKAASGLASTACTDCVLGTYAPNDGSSECANAATGNYVDVVGATGTSECQQGQYQDEEGASECKSCAEYKEDQDTRPYYFNIETGQAKCVQCPCNNPDRSAAVESCDIETGYCKCGALWVDARNGLGEGNEANDVRCDEEQDVDEAMQFAYSFFGFFLLFIIPFIFSSGGLAVLGGVWRRDVSIIVYKMRERTHKAIQIKNRQLTAKARREIDKRLTTAFDALDGDASGEIDEDELGMFFELLNLELTEEEVSEAMVAVDLDGNGVVDVDEFRHLISFVAPLVKQRQLVVRQKEIFDMVDVDGSGGIDAYELREASKVLGVSLDHIAEDMDEWDSLSFDAFARVLEDLNRETRHYAAVVARSTKEGYLYSTFLKLRRNDGTFTLGSFRKSLAAIGLSLSQDERIDLFERVLPLPKPDEDKKKKRRSWARMPSFSSSQLSATDKDGTKDGQLRHHDPHTRSLTYREYRVMLAAAVLEHECDYFPMSKYKEAFLSFEGPEDRADQGFVGMHHLSELLNLAGHPQTDERVAEIASELDRGDELLLFDDFADVMHRFCRCESGGRGPRSAGRQRATLEDRAHSLLY
jgi:Ca2+-binding EF-hand superfamily protein